MPILFIEPGGGPAPFVDFIEDARGPIDINVYHLSSRPVLRAMAEAHRRGEPVHVMIDERLFRMSRHLVEREIARIRATGARVFRAMAAPRAASSELDPEYHLN